MFLQSSFCDAVLLLALQSYVGFGLSVTSGCWRPNRHAVFGAKKTNHPCSASQNVAAWTMRTIVRNLSSSSSSGAELAFLDTEESSSWEEESDSDKDGGGGATDDNDHYSSAQEDAEATDDDEPQLVKEYRQWLESVEKTLLALEKKQKSLENELKKAESIEDTVARAQLLTTYLYLFTKGVDSAIVQDWEQDGKEVELKLDPTYDSAADEANALFQQARKLKRGSQIVANLLAETSQGLEQLQECKVDLDAALSNNNKVIDENLFRLVQDRLLRTARITNFVVPPKEEELTMPQLKSKRNSNKKPILGTPASNVRKVTTQAGCTILVGRNRRGNEYLSMTVARGKDDVWMHARGSPGAHVLLLQRRGGPLATEECLQLAANLAVFYSDARLERSAPVTVAEPKHILKPRHAPLGAVKLRQESKVLTGYPELVPEEFKEAREESGQVETYRASDKAKHRKRTKKAAAQQQAKKKKAKRQKK